MPDDRQLRTDVRDLRGCTFRRRLYPKDGLRLKEILARCPELEATRRHVGSFACMIRDLNGDRLAARIRIPARLPRDIDRGCSQSTKLRPKSSAGFSPSTWTVEVTGRSRTA
jgi:hypothetical protein